MHTSNQLSYPFGLFYFLVYINVHTLPSFIFKITTLKYKTHTFYRYTDLHKHCIIYMYKTLFKKHFFGLQRGKEGNTFMNL